MHENSLRGERSKTYKVTTDRNHAFNLAPNLLNRTLRADQPNQKRTGDISDVWTREGWLCVAVILNLQSRRVIGWAGSNCLTRDLARRALTLAIGLRQPPKGCIHPRGRGSQYGPYDDQKILRQDGFKLGVQSDHVVVY